MHAARPPHQVSLAQSDLDEWKIVQDYLNSCGLPPKNFLTVRDFCRYIRDGDPLCQLLQKAYFRTHANEDAWIKLCNKYGKVWPGYKAIRNELSDFIIEENANWFLTIVSKELKVPQRILFRDDELRAMVDMHAVFKVLAYLSNQEFFKKAFPHAIPFKVKKRGNYPDAATLNRSEQNSCLDDVYAPIEPAMSGDGGAISGSGMDTLGLDSVSSGPANYLAVYDANNELDNSGGSEIYRDLVTTNTISKLNQHQQQQQPTSSTQPSKKLNETEKQIEAMTYIFTEMFQLQINFTDNLKRIIKTREKMIKKSQQNNKFPHGISENYEEIFQNFDEMLSAHDKVREGFVGFLGTKNVFNSNEIQPSDLKTVLYNNKGMISPANFIDQNYEALCQAHMVNAATIVAMQEKADQLFFNDSHRDECIRAMQEVGLPSKKLKEVLILPIIHMTKLPEIFKRLAKCIQKILNVNKSDRKINSDKSKQYKVPDQKILEENLKLNQNAEKQIKSISMMNNKVKRDIEDLLKSNNMSNKYPLLGTSQGVDLLQDGLCRLDNDLQYSQGLSSYNISAMKRRQVFLYDRVLVVVKRQTKKIQAKYHLEEYDLIEDENLQGSNKIAHSNEHENTSHNNESSNVFTFWSNPWKEKFILKHKSSSQNQTSQDIVFAAHNPETKQNWVEAIREHKKMLNINQSLKSLVDYVNGKTKTCNNETFKEFNKEEILSKSFKENNEKYLYHLGQFIQSAESVLEDPKSLRPVMCSATNVVLPGLFTVGYRVHDRKMQKPLRWYV